MAMADKETQVAGTVKSQDLSVSWISEQGTSSENTDRVCILMMANGQVRLTMQSETLDLKGMRLTKGHVCVFALFEASDPKNGKAADKASEMFMNMMMRYDITKKRADKVMKKCLSKTDKAIAKEFGDSSYKASVAAFAGKDLTACSVNGGKVFILSDEGKLIKFSVSENAGVMFAGLSWKNVMIVSYDYPAPDNEIKGDMSWPVRDLITKRELSSLDNSTSVIRVQKL